MLFFKLLQVAIGNRKELTHTPTAEEWRELFVLAQKQALVGIAFRGVELLPEAQRPPKSLLMQWYMATERIKAMNADLGRKALAVANKFLAEGFPSMVLKGQGIAKLYRVEHSLSSYRTPGDIDIWLSGERKEILRYVRKHVPDCKPVYHHVDFPVIEGLDIEVHFTPSWMNSPMTNRRLQQWFRSFTCHLSSVSYKEIPSPSLAFNRVYILVHIYRHLFHEGIGLRQLLDYHFVLRQGFTEEEREETMRTLHTLGMKRFTSAVMWVLQEVFGMEDKYFLISPNEREGRFLLNEMMRSGNFGQYDQSLRRLHKDSDLSYALRKLRRISRFIRSYPSEVLWSPFFKVWHYFWRKKMQAG